MWPCISSVIDHRWCQNMVRTKKVAHEQLGERVTDVLTTFWGHLWTLAEQMHGNIYSFYTINTTRHGSSGVYLMHNCIQITSSSRDTYFIRIANTWNALPNNIKGIITLGMLKVNFLLSKKESLLRLSF